jgi:hypothetical protein
VCRTSMQDLLFTNLGDGYPFSAEVRVTWREGVFEFVLLRKPGLLVTAERCYAANSGPVLGAFLHQLLAETPSAEE